MGKYLFLAVALILVVIALFTVAKNMGQSLKFENIASVLKLGFQAPSAQNNARGSVSLNVETSTARPYIPGPPVVVQTAPQNQITPPQGFTLKDLSPYYGEVTVGSVYPGTLWNTGQVSLYTSYSSKSGIDVTGWTIKSNRGSLLIPQAILDYNPWGYGADSDIVLKNGGRLDIYNSTSPIGKNLRINKCMGFLNNTYKFSPSLECSYAKSYSDSDISNLTGDCQNFISSLGGCTSPSVGQVSYFSNEPACQAVLNNINYTGCYRENSNSSDFFSGRWIAWIPGTWSLDESHDRVLLFDKNGLLVDEYTY